MLGLSRQIAHVPVDDVLGFRAVQFGRSRRLRLARDIVGIGVPRADNRLVVAQEGLFEGFEPLLVLVEFASRDALFDAAGGGGSGLRSLDRKSTV